MFDKDFALSYFRLRNKADRRDFILKHTQGILYEHDLYILAGDENPNVILVAHYDTVFDDDLYLDEPVFTENRILNTYGADDGAGVLSLIYFNRQSIPKVAYLFTDLEEVGALGADAFSTDYSIEDFPDLKFLVEIDRKGLGQCVFYNNEPEDFKDFIAQFGFREERGTSSDIRVIGRAFGIASVNLSAGYYNAHRNDEYLDLSHLAYTLSRIPALLEKAKSVDRFYLP